MERGQSGSVRRAWKAGLALAVAFCAAVGQAQTIHQATLAETNPSTPELSTDEVRRILADWYRDGTPQR